MSKKADTNRAAIELYLKNRGLNPAQIAGIVSNIAVESAYTFDPAIKQRGRADPAYGLFQFDPRGKGLDTPYQQYLVDTKKTDGMASQLDFMLESLDGSYKPGRDWIGAGNASKWGGITDPTQATEFFSNKILRPGKPHMDRRLQFLQDNYLGGTP